MDNIYHLALKSLRRLTAGKPDRAPWTLATPDEVSDCIYGLVTGGKPCMIARYGSVELNVVSNFLSVISRRHSVIRYLKGEEYQWWWSEKGLQTLRTNAGFFPLSPDYVGEFCGLMLSCSREVDLLGSWLSNERFLEDYLIGVPRCRLLYLEPYWSKTPWTRALAGKKVLVVHPFAKTILSQYGRREKLFKNPDVLPEFDLKVIPAVQSIGGNSDFNTWFDALRWMEDRMDSTEYDIALIGCGAYGFPLAAHAKRMGKKAVHLGGALQILFGIKGKRWEDPNYSVGFGNRTNPYLEMFNEYWVRPSADECPKDAKSVENGCYW